MSGRLKEAFVIGVPLCVAAGAAMLLSDEAQWAQWFAAGALLALLFLVSRGNLERDENLAEGGDLPAWLVGPGRYVLLGAAVVLGFILGR